jgi:DNA repair protein RecN (Recombination protein N)
MLVELRIRHVAVIESVVVSLGPGLNVLTGETGAGKSIIVGALGMLLGERAATDRVRAGADRAVVEGVFEVGERAEVRAALDVRGIDPGDDHVIIRREVTTAGRSRAWVNGSPVTAATLAEIGGLLVSIHGQHDARLLLDADVQRDLLDAFADAGALRDAVRGHHARVVALRAEELALERRRDEAAQRADALRQLLQEIEQVDPRPGEEEQLDAEIRRLAHAEELRSAAAAAAAVLTADDEGTQAQLRTVRRALATLVRIDPDTSPWQGALEGAADLLGTLASELEQYADAIDADPERLQRLEARRARLVALLRVHGPTVDDVRRVAESARAALALVDGDASALDAVRSARAAADAALRAAARDLGAARRAAAVRLADEVSRLLPELGMPHGQVAVACVPLAEVGSAGGERVEFTARLDAGAELRPLARIASGGELSRVMLALSTVLAQLQDVPTLVFDEIDAGIGGAVAVQVGALMRRVARHHQVLAISHLAQIAARAHHHVVVRKDAVGVVTSADTRVVTGEERIAEVARMLGGDAEREVSRAHARELLERAAREPVESPPPRTPAAQRRGKPKK